MIHQPKKKHETEAKFDSCVRNINKLLQNDINDGVKFEYNQSCQDNCMEDSSGVFRFKFLKYFFNTVF